MDIPTVVRKGRGGDTGWGAGEGLSLLFFSYAWEEESRIHISLNVQCIYSQARAPFSL